jgi:hypothetical protein
MDNDPLQAKDGIYASTCEVALLTPVSGQLRWPGCPPPFWPAAHLYGPGGGAGLRIARSPSRRACRPWRSPSAVTRRTISSWARSAAWEAARFNLRRVKICVGREVGRSGCQTGMANYS